MFEEISNKLSGALSSILPSSSFTDYLIANAFLVITILLVLVVIIFLFLAFFFDFITDVWKIPFAVAIDVLSYLGLGVPILSLAAAIGALLVFLFLADAKFWKWVFGIIAAILAIIPFFSISPYAIIIAVIPFTTVLMFLDTIVD